MQKDKLIATLLELESLIKPGKVEDVLLEFGRELVRRFDLDCFVAEVPMLGMKIEIPEGQKEGGGISFEGSATKFHICGDLEGMEKAVRSLLERLDYVILHSIYYEFWRNILEGSPDAIVLVNERGEVVECNKKAQELFGKKMPEIRGGVWEFRGRFYSVAEYRLGRVKAIVLRDITKIKELERSARESEEKFRALAEAVPIAVMVYQDERYVFANKAAEELTGYSKRELLDGKFWEIFPEDERRKILEKMKKRLKGEQVEPYRTRIRRKNGEERIVRVHGALVKQGNKSSGIVAMVDITREEEEKKKLEKLTEILKLINRLLRHDVINALTSAIAYLEIYEDVKEEEMLYKAKEAIERAVRIVKDMREFESAVRGGDLEVVNVREVAEEVAKGFAIPINIEGECNVLADKGLVAVFENIFQNAVQHGETDRIDVKIKKAGKYCEIRIADYGKGIPDEIKGKVFEKGFKYGPKASTGFGLYAVKKLIERYGGEIWVEDNKPRGAVFVIRLTCVC